MGTPGDRSASQTRNPGTLEVYLLGVVDFDAAVLLQKHVHSEIADRDDAQGTLLLCEHPPIVTVGRAGSRADVLTDESELTSRRLEVRWLNRGGGCLVHGPGQLAVYPILPLDRLDCGLRDFRARLENAVLGCCREQHVPAWTYPDRPGVGCRSGQFAFVGAAVNSWVSYHGLFVNVAPRMDLMRLARSTPNGSRITSLAAQRRKPTPMHAVREALVRNLAEQFGYDDRHVYTGHPLLKRERRRAHAYA
ncbi:MAG: lipoyl(octanoyl) transferase LipB [Planctomycetaceae bacterium]